MDEMMMERRRRFGARLSARREELRLSQEEIADRVGISQAHVSKYEKGAVKSHTPEELAAFARALETTPAEIARWAEYGIDVIEEDAREDRYAHLALPPDVTDGELRLLRFLFHGIRLYEQDAAAVEADLPEERSAGGVGAGGVRDRRLA